jgi:hypothetical protein
MGHRHAQLRRRQGAGESGVGVPVHEHHVGPVGAEVLLHRRKDAGGLSRVGAAAGAELVIGLRDAELVEEDPRQLVVVMLASVDDPL